MIIKTRKFQSLSDIKKDKIREYLAKRKVRKIEEQLLEREIVRKQAEHDNFGYSPKFAFDSTLTSTVFNSVLETSFFDSIALDELMSNEKNRYQKIINHSMGVLNTAEREAFRVDKIIKQELIEFDRKGKVEYQNFLDNEESEDSKEETIEDPKTGLTISNDYVCLSEGRAGLRLPAETVTEVKFRECLYDYENTDFTDPMLKQRYENPNFAYMNDKVLTHRIIKQTNWKKQPGPGKLSLLFSLPGLQTINCISIHSLSSSKTVITGVYFFNEDNEWESIDFKCALSIKNEVLLFSPVTCKELKISFRQITPIQSGMIRIAVDEVERKIEADVYEFVIGQVKAERIRYKNLGFYSTSKTRVRDALSFSITEKLLDIEGSHRSHFGVTGISSDSLVDKYFVIKSKIGDYKGIDCIVSAPSAGREEEILIPFGDECRLNFAPKLSAAHLKIYGGSSLLTIGTDYEVSYDNGVTWISSYSNDDDVVAKRAPAKAKLVKIKLINHDPRTLYRASYNKEKNQELDESGQILLKNGYISFKTKQRKFSGEISVLYVLRSVVGNPFITPLISSYFLVVKEKNNV